MISCLVNYNFSHSRTLQSTLIFQSSSQKCEPPKTVPCHQDNSCVFKMDPVESCLASWWIRGYIYCSGPSLWGLHFLRGKYCPTKCPGSLCPLFSLERREHDGDKADCLKVWQDLSSSLVGKGKRIHIVMWLNGGYERSKISFCADFPAIQRELETVAHSAFPCTAQSHHTFCFPTILACIKCEAGSETACKREKTKTLSSSKCLNTLSR